MFDPVLIRLDGPVLAECVLPHALALAYNAKVPLLRLLDKDQ